MNLLDADQSNERAELLAKWKDKPNDEVINAKVDSDLYIKTLEKRVDDIRTDYIKMTEELQSRANLQELRDQITELQNKSSSGNLEANEDKGPKFDPKEVQSLVSSEIAKSKQADREVANFNTVKAKLVEKYGTGYQTHLNEQMNTLGLTDTRLNEMARTEPRVLIKLLDLDTPIQRETFQTPPRSGQRQDNFAPTGPTKRDWYYYQELKKTNPKLYLDPKIAVQMHDDAIALGAAFNMPD